MCRSRSKLPSGLGKYFLYLIRSREADRWETAVLIRFRMYTLLSSPVFCRPLVLEQLGFRNRYLGPYQGPLRGQILRDLPTAIWQIWHQQCITLSRGKSVADR